MGYEVWIICDRCGKSFGWDNTAIGIAFAKKIARGKGWSVGKKWLCNACKKAKDGENK